MIPAFLAVFFLFQIFACPLYAQSRSAPSWDAPKKVDENTVFFGEKKSLLAGQSGNSLNERLEPQAGEKSYAWRLLEQGNNFLLAGHLEKASAAFAKCYEVGGPTRVLSGFKRLEALQKLGRWDEALAVLEDLKQKYLVSTKEFGEAVRIRANLEDAKRKSLPTQKPAKLTGREWLLGLQPERMKFVLQGMDILRAHNIPLKEPAHKYAFRLDEYYIAHPEAPADDPAEALAVVIYELDQDARLPIDRWRLSSSGPGVRSSEAVPTPSFGLPTALSGAEWVRFTHNEKMDYILDAVQVLKAQNVPLQKTVYAYVYAADQLFTNKPELSASDSVVTLASILFDTEPEAREVLEAIRFK